MRLTNQEKEIFDKFGFEVRDGHIAHKDDIGELHYAGFNMYISDDNRLFEKKGNKLVECSHEELEAENRFLAKNSL